MKSENPSSLNNIPENNRCGTRTIGKSVIAILASFTNEDMNNPVVADDNIDKKHIICTSQNESINILYSEAPTNFWNNATKRSDWMNANIPCTINLDNRYADNFKSAICSFCRITFSLQISCTEFSNPSQIAEQPKENRIAFVSS